MSDGATQTTESATAAFEGVTKRFGGRTVLDKVTMRFAPATRYVIRGPSGCGKSTLLNLLAGYAEPDAGRIRRSLTTGYVMQDELLFSAMSVRENMHIRAAALKLPDDLVGPLVLDALMRANVVELIDATIARMSGGERQRVQLAAQLMASADLLLLDEPTSRLDAANRRGIAKVVAEAFHERTVVVVTHDEDSPFQDGAILLELRNGGLARA